MQHRIYRTAKPFVKWVGGKTQLLGDIERTLPSDFSQKKNVIYVEPFVGGGAVLFWILQQFPNIQKAVINDINPHLITTYKVIKEQPYKLIEQLKELQEKGIKIARVTLHVGLGTFRPVKVDNVLEHKMHDEYYEISEESVEIINTAKEQGNRIFEML